jgi:general secretion pathway protein G
MIDRATSLRAQGGFTLVELMIVMVVLGILAGVILFAVDPFQAAANASHSTTVNRECQTADLAAQADASNGGSHTASDFTDGGCP